MKTAGVVVRSHQCPEAIVGLLESVQAIAAICVPVSERAATVEELEHLAGALSAFWSWQERQ